MHNHATPCPSVISHPLCFLVFFHFFFVSSLFLCFFSLSLFRREQWVRSATWDGSHAAGVLERMTSLAYSMSEASMSTEGCEVCRPRKGHPHQATHQLSYFGVCYDPVTLILTHTHTHTDTTHTMNQFFYFPSFYYFFIFLHFQAKLTHPFKKDEIILSDHYEQHQFNVGQLCHQRLKLYHVMKHFKSAKTNKQFTYMATSSIPFLS